MNDITAGAMNLVSVPTIETLRHMEDGEREMFALRVMEIAEHTKPNEVGAARTVLGNWQEVAALGTAEVPAHLKDQHEETKTNRWVDVMDQFLLDLREETAAVYGAVQTLGAVRQAHAELNAARIELDRLRAHEITAREAVAEFYPSAVAYAEEQGACSEFERATEPLFQVWPDVIAEHDRRQEVEVTATQIVEISRRSLENGDDYSEAGEVVDMWNWDIQDVETNF